MTLRIVEQRLTLFEILDNKLYMNKQTSKKKKSIFEISCTQLKFKLFKVIFNPDIFYVFGQI